MRRYLIANLVLLVVLLTGAFSYTGDGSNGFITGESVTATNMNEIATALNNLQDADVTMSNLYLPFTGGTITGIVDFASGSSLTISSGGQMLVGSGAGVAPFGTGTIRATSMSATGQIDDNDLASGAVDLGGAEVEGTLPVANGGTGATALTNLLTLATHTVGNYVATIADSGASEITVSGSGSENAAITLAIASTLTRDTELANISAATSTDNAIVRFDGTSGDVQDSLATVADTTGTITTPGALSVGGSTGASTFTMRNTADSGWVECGVVTTTFTCAVDADGTPDGTL